MWSLSFWWPFTCFAIQIGCYSWRRIRQQSLMVVTPNNVAQATHQKDHLFGVEYVSNIDGGLTVSQLLMPEGHVRNWREKRE